MPVKIRLQRHGKKGKPFYWLVAADSRAKRDGRYLEKLGTYNPNSNPATVEINTDNAVSWLEKGAQPTDTARTLLSYKGVMLKYHLNGGVRKGALTQEEADKKLTTWLEEKNSKIQIKKEGLTQAEVDLRVRRLAEEKAVSDKRLSDAAAQEAEANAAEEALKDQPADEVTEEVAKETPVNEVTEEIAKDKPAEELTKEAIKEEPANEVTNEAAKEEPSDEAEQVSEEKEK
mgnify:CR=1 FL=1